MANFPSQVENIPKWHQKKYFASENGNGKGDLRREYTPEGDNNYRENKFFDNCEFERKKRLKEVRV